MLCFLPCLALSIWPGVSFVQIQDEYDRIKTQRVNEAVMFRKISRLKDPSKRCALFAPFLFFFVTVFFFCFAWPCLADCVVRVCPCAMVSLMSYWQFLYMVMHTLLLLLGVAADPDAS